MSEEELPEIIAQENIQGEPPAELVEPTPVETVGLVREVAETANFVAQENMQNAALPTLTDQEIAAIREVARETVAAEIAKEGAKAVWDDTLIDVIVSPWQAESKQTYKNRRAIVRRKDRPVGQFLRGAPAYSYVERKNCEIYHVGVLDDFVGWGDSGFEVQILKEEPNAPGCKIEDHFTKLFIEELEKYPKNGVMRAHIMAKLLTGVPGEIETYDALKNWIETTFPKSLIPRIGYVGKLKMDSEAPSSPPSAPAAQAPVNQGPTLDLTYHQEGTERGLCNYYRAVSGESRFSLNMQFLTALIQGDGLSMDEMVEHIQGWARDNVAVTHNSVSEYEHDSYVPDDVETEVSEVRQDIESALRSFLEASNPELLETLENN